MLANTIIDTLFTSYSSDSSDTSEVFDTSSNIINNYNQSNRLDIILRKCNKITGSFNYLKNRQIGLSSNCRYFKNNRNYNGYRLIINGENSFVKMWYIIDYMHKNDKKIFITPYLDYLTFEEIKTIDNCDLVFLIDLVQTSHISYVKELNYYTYELSDDLNKRKKKSFYPANIVNICFVSHTCRSYAYNYWELYKDL